ncbi:MAG: hypothetical protein ACR2RV_11920 [Verrucomicrobiales bacterium]
MRNYTQLTRDDRHVLVDRRAGGDLYKLLCERPPSAINRSRIGHWEIDTVMGSTRACILTLVERKAG